MPYATLLWLFRLVGVDRPGAPFVRENISHTENLGGTGVAARLSQRRGQAKGA